MDQNDIDDFLRRSNSICDQNEDEVTPDAGVRRMSLKEFTGLDRKTDSEFSLPPLLSWKNSSTASSLLNSYSARRRSVLSNDVLDSPSKRLAAPKEESLDLPTAIDRISALRHRLESTEVSSSPSGEENLDVLMDECRRMLAVIKEFATVSFEGHDHKCAALIAEVTDCADCLSTHGERVVANGNVYSARLVATELAQVLSCAHSFLCLSRNVNEGSSASSVLISSLRHFESAVNQMIRAISTKS